MMKGILLKDVILIRNSLSFVYLFPLVIILLCGSTNIVYLATIVELVMPLFSGLLLYNVMYAEENSHWKRFEIGLPITRSKVLREKYLLGGILIVAAAIIDIVLACVFSFFGVDVLIVVSLVAIAISFGIIYIAILIPSVLQFGVSKGPIVFISCIAMLTLIPFVFNYFDMLDRISLLLTQPTILTFSALTMSILAVFLSYIIALRIQRTCHE